MTDIDTGTYKVRRFKKGVWKDDGRYSRGDLEKEFDTDASVQPATGSQIKLLPEHRRSSQVNVVFSEEELFTSDEKSQKAADIFIYKGKYFEVMNVKDWSDTDIPHYECLIVKEDGQ